MVEKGKHLKQGKNPGGDNRHMAFFDSNIHRVGNGFQKDSGKIHGKKRGKPKETDKRILIYKKYYPSNSNSSYKPSTARTNKSSSNINNQSLIPTTGNFLTN